MKKTTAFFLSAAMAVASGTGAKKVLDHSSFDDWKAVVNHGLSDDGRWEAFSVNPQEGDGVFVLRDTKTGKEIKIERGYTPAFSADSKWAVALIKPHYTDTRSARIKKKKGFDLPQDSLAIVDLTRGEVTKIANVISYKIGEKGGDWIAYKSCDTVYIKPKALKDKKAGKPMIVRHLPTGQQKLLKWVDSYVFAENGLNLAFTLKKMAKDTLTTEGVAVILLPDTSMFLVDRDAKFYGVPVFSSKGDKLAYTSSKDTVETGTRKTTLHLADMKHPLETPRIWDLNINVNPGQGAEEIWSANQYTKPVFSHDGRRLIAGVAPSVAPDDTTIVKFERADLDIWRWDAPMTPPQEKSNLKRLREKTYPVVINLETAGAKPLLVSAAPFGRVYAPDRWDGDQALVVDGTETIISTQWDYTPDKKMSLVNLNNGKVTEIGNLDYMSPQLSPADKYVIWFKDKNYYVYDIATGQTRNMTADIPYPLWDEDQDRPSELSPYGVAAWSENDDALLVYDRHDIWRLDPSGKKQPENLTKGEGRAKNLRFRYLETDDESRFVKPGEELTLTVFDYANKCNGLAVLKYGVAQAPSVKTLDTYSFTQVKKAKNAKVYSWQRANFNTSPDIWLCNSDNFGRALQISDANPQMKDYSWGTPRLEKWYTYDGRPAEGILYVPEDYDPDKKYPMLCVFYETNTHKLYNHFTMEPSWSWVNYPFYVSRGYVILVPDIHYTAGVPGESAYQYVCSGAEEMCKRYPWIDKDRIGIDGQSWGGYQTAFLVTRTDMFACAGSGAPVSNMTSAFGGIRWGTGDSRQGQYEQGQSRIGRNLWETPYLYMANSPIFFADRVNTPLLIMHNDSDGAVPWWQGVELFMALRRLGKPVWMLQYNDEQHNLVERRNRKDITRRLQQFFDHYLKGDPMPEWMKNGIPMIRKGQEMGYGLSK